jgi:threonine/homoserine/homoserine lactone efflux protein
MSIYSVLGLSVAMFLLAITPGPGVFATVSKALASGFRHTIPVIIGIVMGDLVFLLFAIYGLSAIAETFNTLFMVIKYLGAGYLVWLGIKLWRTRPEKVDVTASQSRSGKYGFLGGLSITLGNPKVILFYLGFLPTFLDLSSLTTLDVGVVALVVSVVLGAVMLFYAFTASRARKLFKNDSAQQKLNRVAGSAMIGTGAILISRS